MVHAKVDGVGVRQEDEVAEGAGTVVAVDTVNVPGRVFFGRFAECALYSAATVGTVDAAQTEYGRGEGAAEREAFAFEEAFAAVGFGVCGGVFINPFAVFLSIDAGAGDEDEALEISLWFEGREQVSRSLDVGEPVGFVRGVAGGDGMDGGVEVWGKGGWWQGFGEVDADRFYGGWESFRVAAEAEDSVALGGEEETEGGADIAATGDQDTHAVRLPAGQRQRIFVLLPRRPDLGGQLFVLGLESRVAGKEPFDELFVYRVEGLVLRRGVLEARQYGARLRLVLIGVVLEGDADGTVTEQYLGHLVEEATVPLPRTFPVEYHYHYATKSTTRPYLACPRYRALPGWYIRSVLFRAILGGIRPIP